MRGNKLLLNGNSSKSSAEGHTYYYYKSDGGKSVRTGAKVRSHAAAAAVSISQRLMNKCKHFIDVILFTCTCSHFFPPVPSRLSVCPFVCRFYQFTSCLSYTVAHSTSNISLALFFKMYISEDLKRAINSFFPRGPRLRSRVHFMGVDVYLLTTYHETSSFFFSFK